LAFDYSKLRGRIREVFNTQENFAKNIEISTVSLSAKLNGKVQFTQVEIAKSIKMLEIGNSEISDYFFKQKLSLININTNN